MVKYEEPKMEVTILNRKNVVRTSSGLEDVGDIEDGEFGWL